jgi:hypothetical protein
MLGLVTMFWWLGESIAIRLGKYEYDSFPLRLPLPFGGSPTNPSWLDTTLLALLPDPERVPANLDATCVATSWDIPLPVVALEAALLFGFFRLAVGLVRSEKGGRVRAALATGGLSALLMVNVFAVLDPVVSTTRWCEPGITNPNGEYLHYGLWTWFTTNTHQGYWYGVPLVNYAAWFLAAAAFAFVARLDDERPSGLIRRHATIFNYALATIGVTVLYFVVLIGAKIVIDRIMVGGQEYLFTPHAIFSPRLWQFGVVTALLGIGLWAARRAARQPSPRVHWISAAPKLAAFAFCFAALLLEPHPELWTVWVVTAVVAGIALLWPRILATRQRLLLLGHRLLDRWFGKGEPSTSTGETPARGDVHLGV